MIDSADHITPKTGLSPTVTLRKNGGSFASPAGAISEIGSGWYRIAPNATDANTLGPLLLHATGAGADPCDDQFDVLLDLVAASISLSASSTSVSALTARALITSALKRLGVLAAGETLPAEQATDGLEILNDLVDSWNTENLTAYAVGRQTYTLTANQGVRTIGPSGNFSAVRPLSIQNASVIPVGSTLEYPLLPLTRDQYAGITDKTLTEYWPTWFLYETTSPDATITFYPVPTTAATLVLYTRNQLSQWANLATAYSLPPGYARALRLNLAIELAPMFGATVTPDLYQSAADAKGNIKRQNMRLADLTLDSAVLMGQGGWYDIRTDGTR